MPNYVMDADRDLWKQEVEGVDDWWCLSEDVTCMALAELERRYGPLVPCDVDRNPLPQIDEARALLADAFDDLRSHMDEFPPFSGAQSIPDAIMSQVAGWVGQWAADTAAGLRA